MRNATRLCAAALAALLLLPAFGWAQGQGMVTSDEILKQLEKKPAGGATRSFRGVVVNTAVDTQAQQAEHSRDVGAAPAAQKAQAATPPQPAQAARPADKPQVTVYLYFRSGTADLADEASRKQLAALGKALSSPALAGAKFEIGGHTDAQGSDEANQALSERRAAFVRNELVSRFGLSAASVDARGYGESQPVADNGSEAGRAKNRRVVVKRLD